MSTCPNNITSKSTIEAEQKGCDSDKNKTIDYPQTDGAPWSLYNHLIDQIPTDVFIKSYGLGLHWSYVEADCGMGVAWTASGGAARTVKHDLRGLSLREVAQMSKSWNFQEATLGIAALNAWYCQKKLLDPLGATYDELIDLPDGTQRKMDAFALYRNQMDGKNVVVVGHFPRVGDIAEYANLTVLERNVRSDLDTPDPACEYIMPSADFAFITGVTFINKTAPRLISLAPPTCKTVFTGPSVVMSPYLFTQGVSTLAGSVVADPEAVKFAVHNGAGRFFGKALCMTLVTAHSAS